MAGQSRPGRRFRRKAARFGCAGLSALLFALFIAVPSRAELVLYPSPGDLSSVANLKESDHYTVSVNGQSCFVYETDNYWAFNGGTPDDIAESFAYFSFRDMPVTVEVTPQFQIDSVSIRPKSAGVSFVQNGNHITFSLDKPRKLSIEVNGRKEPLFIFADAPDVPDTSAQHYFGPGVHHIGLDYPVAAGEHVYIAGGAVVEGTLLTGGSDVTVSGRGILSGGAWTGTQHLIDDGGNGTTGHHYTGIVMLDSPSWFLRNGGNNQVFTDLKVIGYQGTSDGPHMDGSNGLLDDCFISNNDDALISSWGSTNTLENTIVRKHSWGRPMASLAGGPNQQHDITWQNIDVIGDEGLAQNSSAMMAMFPIGTITTESKKNYLFKNIRIEDPRKAPLVYLDAGHFPIQNITFENVSVETELADEGQISASGTNGSIDGLHFKCLTMGGKVITSLGDAHITVSGNVTNVTFAGCTAPLCPNGVCDPGETWQTCPADCPTPHCPNGKCDAGETQESCPQDCTGVAGAAGASGAAGSRGAAGTSNAGGSGGTAGDAGGASGAAGSSGSGDSGGCGCRVGGRQGSPFAFLLAGLALLLARRRRAIDGRGSARSRRPGSTEGRPRR